LQNDYPPVVADLATKKNLFVFGFFVLAVPGKE